jgi:hypothetical protein
LKLTGSFRWESFENTSTKKITHLLKNHIGCIKKKRKMTKEKANQANDPLGNKLVSELKDDLCQLGLKVCGKKEELFLCIIANSK